MRKIWIAVAILLAGYAFFWSGAGFLGH